ncbi:MAG: hypothetical protein E7295_06270 [Lachnospiraceae bacterium]|nr:hypothetical protein [Lachnospiraceae bacterium]
MSKLRQFLETVDEEYLIGLSNKGIVKRSYKDLENTTVEITEEGEEIRGICGDAQVVLKLPLTNSTCSCPSTSICKHVIMTLLTAQKADGEAQKAGGKVQNVMAQETTSSQGDAPSQEINTAAGEEAPKEEAPKEEAPKESASKVTESREDSPKEEIGEKILRVPSEKLKKALSSKDWIKLLTQTNFSEDFEIQKEKLITVRNAKTNATVKLMYPLELSTCSICHDEKLCYHKVGAILAMQLQAGVCRLESLMDAAVEQSEEFDEESVPEVLTDLKAFLSELFLIGGARLSPETSLGAERFALRAHNARLPKLEDQLRALAETIAGYQGRQAKVTVSSVMQRLTECYAYIELLERTMAEGKSVYSLAGAFHTAYFDVPELMLHGIGMRAFESATGFAGKTIYFFEENTKRFYTYTVARPTIYEKSNVKYRPQSQTEVVPWGLNCTLVQLSSATIKLKNGKANEAGRLSSTSQARADLITVGGALPDSIGDTIYDDFEELWAAYRKRMNAMGEELSEAEKLFLIRPKSLLNMHYDEIRQKLLFWFEDFAGRRLRGELAYSKQEEMAIRSLERLVKKCGEGKELPVFLGVLYAEEGECSFYPIETIGEGRLTEG